MRGNFITDRNGELNPNYKHGMKGTRLFRIWTNIKTRCLNPNTPHYHRYGGRGITVCDEWRNDFKAFYDWSMSHGYTDELTIDRIDNNGNYYPENCRWVTIEVQALNRSKHHYYEVKGKTKPLAEWCKIYEKNYKSVRDRLKRGWSIERALIEPIQTKFRRK
jgi:hypothetical protein